MDDAHAELLDAVLNMTAAHRQHEQFYGAAPREQAVVLQRHGRTLLALADRWERTRPVPHPVMSPYEGAEDLNADAATQLDGVLFLEGEGEPVEITMLERDLRTIAADSAAAGAWLATAMSAAWAFVPHLFPIDGLADLLGERHRIIANDWQAASLMTLASEILARAAELLEQVEFTPAALRSDLGAAGASIGFVTSAAELIDHAAELLSDFAGLVHDNERRWRVFRARVVEIAAAEGDARHVGRS
jgi:hypothetical protein